MDQTDNCCTMRKKISLIILTLNAEKYIGRLLDKIMSQTVLPDEIIAVDSQSDDRTVEICRRYDRVRVLEIYRKDFDHGGTRNEAFLAAKGEIVLMLSQDVLPVDEKYIENLIQPLYEDERIVACSGRHIAYSQSSLREKLTRQFNYKDYSFVRDKSDIDKLGIKAFFLSDCCSAYRKNAVVEVGMYEYPCLATEDMILAAKLLNAGYKIAYAAEAAVYHSHDYTLKMQYARNFDISVAMAMHNDYFGRLRSEAEGIKMVRYVLTGLLKKGHFIMAIYYCIDCAVRLIAHEEGKKYKRYSAQQLKKRTANVNYWRRIGVITD